MIRTVRNLSVVFLATSALTAQSVLLSEVRADAGGRWVELHNKSAATVDLSSWTLHHGSHTPSMPQDYWWGFPAGTVLAPGGFLRVHWFQTSPGNTPATDFYTGTTIGSFLFGLGGEALDSTRGAFGLFRTQSAEAIASPQMVEDWVSWGEHGFSREDLAVQAGRWTADRHAPAIPAGSSIARNVATFGLLAHDEQWFVDASPTPLAPNLSGAAVIEYGASCAVVGHHLLGAPALHAPSLPLLGNAQFRLTIDNTTGIYGEYALIVWSAAASPGGVPSVLAPVAGGCAESIDVTQLITLWLVPTQVATTTVPMSLANMPVSLVGTAAHAQVLVLDLLPYGWLPWQGLSNALNVVFGQ